MIDIKQIRGLGPKNLSLLNKLNIYNSHDLLIYYPYRYNIIKRTSLMSDNIIIDGVITSLPIISFFKAHKSRLTFNMDIESKMIKIVLFNRPYLKKQLIIGQKITIMGKYDQDKNLFTASDLRLYPLPQKSIIEPLYHTTYGLKQSSIRTYMHELLTDDLEVIDYIPSYLNEKYHLISKIDALKIIHEPNNVDHLKQALIKLKYEELLIFMLKINYLKQNNVNNGLVRKIDLNEINNFIHNLPFVLTSDQETSINEIIADLNSPKRMNRLLQGDVGSGKSIVAFTALLANCLGGYNGALMAPTEILAKQHYQNLITLLKPFGINIRLLIGSTDKKSRKEINEDLSKGQINIIVGTHTLIQDDITFNNLGLVITDEQHRFGVSQRSNLRNKGLLPDVLYLSATPIPRTYALTIYNDMDISTIKTPITGRKQVITYLKSEHELKYILKLIQIELINHHQVYVVAPAISDVEDIKMENVSTLEQKFHRAFPENSIGVLHGKMNAKAKDEVMTSFYNQQIDILISTTVIEVGVDIKNATMLVVFNAERFGLSQLHQLRGRVGRSDIQSYCILISNEDKERLNILTKTNDGFEISTADFEMRGQGDLFGVRQSGDMNFKLADLKRDFKILLQAKEDAIDILKHTTDLSVYGNALKQLDFKNQLD